MRFVTFKQDDKIGLAMAMEKSEIFHGFFESETGFPGHLQGLISQGPEALHQAGVALQSGPAINLTDVQLLPPLSSPPKIICVGLNYADHSAEAGFKQPEYPTIFGRFASSIIGAGSPIKRPNVSSQLDYEGEIAAIIGKGGRDIPKVEALDHVAGYALFNDASVRDYQMKTPQWTMGKNFDDTGAFGPWFVTADELPPGLRELRLQTRLNGVVLQDASTDDMVFDVATLISLLSVTCTLTPGDVIVTGTPAGVGMARSPQIWMKPGDICEVEVEGMGVLRNPVVAQ